MSRGAGADRRHETMIDVHASTLMPSSSSRTRLRAGGRVGPSTFRADVGLHETGRDDEHVDAVPRSSMRLSRGSLASRACSPRNRLRVGTPVFPVSDEMRDEPARREQVRQREVCEYTVRGSSRA